MSLHTLFLLGIAGIAAWLVPNHYPPWVSFHAEALICFTALFALAAELVRRRTPWSISALACVGVMLACVPPIQAAGGLIQFAGDAWTATAFLLCLSLSAIFGQNLAERVSPSTLFEGISLLLVAAGIASVGLQLYQWLSLTGLGIFAIELAPKHSPYANVAQPNHLASMLFLSIIGVLYLQERARVGLAIAVVAVLFLLTGIAMSGSRTAWLNVAMLVLLLWWFRRDVGIRVSGWFLAAIAVALPVLVIAWPVANELLLLSPGRTLAAQAEAGPRPLLWSAMLDAVLRKPWLGYGWNQGLVALSTVAVDHPVDGRLIANSHNLLLDLFIWNGVPLGLAIAGFLAGWFYRQWRSIREPWQVLAFLAVVGIFIHAMLEFPLSYAYFLIPVGMLMGMLDSMRPTARKLLVRRSTVTALSLVAGLLGGAIAYEYLEVEASTRVLRWEVARIGTSKIESPPPDLKLLTQWGAYLRFARMEPHGGATPAELEWMREVVQRFPYRSALVNYAITNGLSGQKTEAQRALIELCAIHTQYACAADLREWGNLASSTFPQLADVPLPAQALVGQPGP